MRMNGDRIFLEWLIFYAYHGVNPEENALGQRFIVDVSLARDLRAAGTSDDLAQTTSYSAVYKLVRAEVESGPYRLGARNPGRLYVLIGHLLRTTFRLNSADPRSIESVPRPSAHPPWTIDLGVRLRVSSPTLPPMPGFAEEHPSSVVAG